jgi:hypothetical protein
MPTKSVGHDNVEAFVADLEAKGVTGVQVAPHEGGVYVTWSEKVKRAKPGEVESR